MTFVDEFTKLSELNSGVAIAEEDLDVRARTVSVAQSFAELADLGEPMTVAGGTFTGLTVTPASAAGGAGFRVLHGVAPTSPVDGDIWTTTTGLFVRINGVTIGPLT